MNSKRREKLLDRLAKLLALESSPNPHEAEAARRSAERFMRKHGLTREESVARQVGYHEVVMPGRGWDSWWKLALATAAARFYGAEAVARPKGTGREVRLVGEHADVVAAARLCRQLFRYLKELEERAARVISEGRSELVDQLDADLPRRVREESFRSGVARGVAQVLFRARPAPPDEQSATPAGSRPVGSRPVGSRPVGSRPEGSPPAGGASAGQLTRRPGAGTGKDHSARVESRYRPQVRQSDDSGLDEVWFYFGQYLAEQHVVMSSSGSVELRGGSKSG